MLGSVVITMVRDADFFMAPCSGMMLDGFIAIGKLFHYVGGSRSVGTCQRQKHPDKFVQYLGAAAQILADLNSKGSICKTFHAAVKKTND